MRTLALTGALLLLGAAAVRAQSAPRPYVIDNNGGRIMGDELRVNDAGDLQLQIGGATRVFRRGSYRDAWVPKPQNVSLLEKALEQKRYDIIVKNAQKVFDEFKYVGWGGHVAYMHALALLEQGQAQQALNVLLEGEPVAGRFLEEVVKGKTEAYLALDKTAEAAKLLEKLKASESAETAAFAFKASGELLQKQGNIKEAVLEYLKIVLLFEPGRADRTRQDAKQRAVALLKEIGDERWKVVEAMK